MATITQDLISLQQREIFFVLESICLQTALRRSARAVPREYASIVHSIMNSHVSDINPSSQKHIWDSDGKFCCTRDVVEDSMKF